LERITQLQGQGPNLASTTTYQDNKTIREVGSLKVRFIPHCETNQFCGFSTEASRFYENHLVFHVSLLEPYHTFTILGRIHDPPPPIEGDGE
jgi:hypothetical protein